LLTNLFQRSKKPRPLKSSVALSLTVSTRLKEDGLKTLILTTLIATVLFSGCFKLELGHVVSDTVSESKKLYQTIKRNANGEEERKYSHSIPSYDESNDVENFGKCKDYIRQIIDDSGCKIIEVSSESSNITFVNDVRSIQCTMIVVVKK
jgi:hypothetical protein